MSRVETYIKTLLDNNDILFHHSFMDKYDNIQNVTVHYNESTYMYSLTYYLNGLKIHEESSKSLNYINHIVSGLILE